MALLIVISVLSLRVSGDSNRRVEELDELQQKSSTYRSLQNADAQLQQLLTRFEGIELFSPSVVSSTFSNEAIESTLRQLQPLYVFDTLDFVPTSEERKQLDQIHDEYQRFVTVMTRAVELDRAGKADDSRDLQAAQAVPVANRIERLVDQLASDVESDIVALVMDNRAAFARSRVIFLISAGGSVFLALLFGLAISWSVITPVQRMAVRLDEIASGDFSRRVDVANRDELGSLAANLNRMNDEIGRLYQDLEAASRHKSEFLASMSHELRTPLNAIIGFSEVLREQMFGPLNERQIDYMGDILASGRHLLALINDILDLSKIEAGKMELELSTFSLPAVLESGLTMVREQAARDGIALVLEVADAVRDLHADERKVKQVVFNLLSNAVKFTLGGGSIRVMARQVDSGIEVAVTDTGIGIAPADQERIFEEFQQASKREGSGLGLALAKSFVELHGGSLWVSSEPGAGSTFTFRLPARVDTTTGAEQTVGESIPVEARSGTDGGTVLVIEDDKRAAELLKLYLEGDGFGVTVVGSGEAGIETAHRLRPAAIVLDLFLPGLSGWDMLAHVKADPVLADIPVVIVSMLDDQGRGYALGAAAHLVKPVGRDELLAVLGPLVRTGTGARPLTVLAIDDDPMALALVESILEAEGYGVLRAGGGEEGIEIARREVPDLVVCDLLMPGVDGFDVVEQLRSEPTTAGIPIVILTAKSIDAADKSRLNEHVAHLAQKGDFSAQAFVDMVRRCCRTHVR